ncbi:MAG: 2-amino-4-hydroxy-6-hydroxymethyldihydropteridine diphosphokinase [Clostridiales bacterium]|jgi:2-amino-4-hydroxy-6-hydroxymethyldihydropteridine diphosphokinase|nr:2-amino-4-hydroxy-6-hydroxymethyldihydropteridine diphosphokinase [Clostridiales bacterium]
MRYFLSLGSNLGRRRRNLARAVEALELAGIAIVKTSSLYETEPVGDKEQPWFLNLVVEASSSLDPEEMLDLIQTIERKLGRRSDERGGPRSIDIDILLAEEKVIQSERLTIPHPRLHQRNFVLQPLEEISAEAVQPLLGMKIKDLRTLSTDNSVVKKLRHPFRYRTPARRNAKTQAFL